MDQSNAEVKIDDKFWGVKHEWGAVIRDEDNKGLWLTDFQAAEILLFAAGSASGALRTLAYVLAEAEKEKEEKAPS